MAQKEAKARIKINKLLEESGWRLLDSKEGKANVYLESNVKMEDLGDNFENTKRGFIDYELRDKDKRTLAILEAKSEDKHPLSAKEQARRYANGRDARFVILSNGNLHYFWDLESGNPHQIITLPREEDFQYKEDFFLH